MNSTLESRATELLLERSRREKHEATYQPREIEGWDQVGLHKSTKSILLAFGGNQSGKSMFSAKEVEWWLRGQHPYKSVPKSPITIWVISTEYVTIKNGVYRHLRQNIPKHEIEVFGPKVQGHDMSTYIKMKNGNTVAFMSAKGGEEVREKFQADKVELIIIDEEITDDLWHELQARQLATEQGTIIISATLVKSEPWILDLEAKAEAGHPDIEMRRFDTRKNPFVNTEKVERFIKNLSKEEIEYRILGRSRKFRGLIYAFDRRLHTISPFDIPKTWPRYCALDPGIRVFGVLWIAVSPEGEKIAYDELYLQGVPVHEVADLIRVHEGWIPVINDNNEREMLSLQEGIEIPKWKPGPDWVPISMRVIDDKMGARTITGEMGVLEQLNNIYGITCVPALKNKRAGIERCRQALRIGSSGVSEFRVFSTLTNFIREILTYRYKDDKTRISQSSPTDEPIKKDDHLLDCWRYSMIMEPDYELVNIDEFYTQYREESADNEEFDFDSTDFDIRDWRRRKVVQRKEREIGCHEILGAI